jgi:hypothetical protein
MVYCKDLGLEARFDVEKAKCVFTSREQNSEQKHNVEVRLKVQISGVTLTCQKIAFVEKLTAD